MPIPPVTDIDPQHTHPWLEALPDSAVLMDGSGIILAANAIWRVFAQVNAGVPQARLGENYLEVCRSAPNIKAGTLPQWLGEVLEGTSTFLEREYPCHSPWARRWFRLTATRFLDAGRSRVVVILREITWERLNEEAAKNREQQLESILAHTREGFVVVQGTGIIRYANPRAGELMGDSPEHMIGRDLGFPIPYPTAQTLELPLAAKGSRSVDVCAVRAQWEGASVWLLQLHDSTDRVTAERALNENEDLLERTNQVARVGGWEADLSTGELRWTAVTRDILEVDRSEPAPPLDEALPCYYKGESYQVVRRNLQHAIDHGVTAEFETRLRTRTGRTKWVRVQAKPELRDGRVTRLLGTFQDVTERRALETRLAEWGAAVEATSEGVIIADAEERITAVNPAFTAITGYAEEEVRGCTPWVLRSAHDHDTDEPLSARLKEQGRWQGEVPGRRRDGEVFPTWQMINAVTDRNGEVTHYVSILTDLTRIKQAEQQLEYLAYHDPLTGLPNRRLFEDRLEQALVQGRRSGEALAVLLLDLDDFKAVNDGFGHDIGDEVLKAVGPRLQHILKAGDTVARWGGDELILLVRDLGDDPSVIAPLAERALDTLEAPFAIGTREFRLTASIGIATSGTSGQSAASLIMQADGAMYWAKNARQRFAFFSDEVGEAARERLHLGTELARALEQGHLAVHYQPQVNLRSGECVGLEALVRWHHPHEGWISPARFIPVAEQSGLILKLGVWVLERACLQASQWLASGWDFGRLAVNVASPQLSSSGLTGQIDRVLNQTGLSPTRLELEVTESSLVESSSSVFETLEGLRDRGIRIAIDDFGTGYSSLRYLKDLPVDRLKIDRSFVEGIPDDEKARTLVQTVMALGSRLGFEVVAEGIENPAQLRALLQEGCLAGQGYLFAKPLDPESIAELRFPLERPDRADGPRYAGPHLVYPDPQQ